MSLELWTRCPKAEQRLAFGYACPCHPDHPFGLVRVPDGAVERMLDDEFAQVRAAEVGRPCAVYEPDWRAAERPKMERLLRAAVGGEGL